MGFLTNNVNETGVQILEWQSQILDYQNRIDFLKQQLNAELIAVKNNSDFTNEDVSELEALINGLK